MSKLEVYNKSYKKAIEIHKITMEFPKTEQYGGIADQLRRSSKSIPANIVEGYGKAPYYKNDFKRMLIYALGSCDETQLWLEMSKDLEYLNHDKYLIHKQDYQHIGKMLTNFIKSINNSFY